MKKITKLALLLLAVAAGNSAQAQQPQAVVLLPNRSYTFSGSAATANTGSVTYQWYRNSIAINGATSASYTLPASLASGVGVEFKRGAVSSACPGTVAFSNVFYVSFCGLIVGNTCWASENAAAANTFASRPDEYTPFFQWNRTTAWAAVGDISGWNSTADNATTWTANPCPSGWRVPTQAEFMALHNVGTTWAAASSARGNAVAGRFYGPNNTSCSLPSNMAGCIFFPAGGYRSGGALSQQGGAGFYWSSTQSSNTEGYLLNFDSNDYNPSHALSKAAGFNIRCVQ